MEYTRIRNERLDEEVLCGVHGSGLRVYIIPKRGFNKYYAVYGTEYGSMNTSFTAAGESEETVLPDGIAHFLEHKMFEQPDGGNAFDLFSETGASSNAFTSFDITAYLFTCTDRFYENLDILLSFVNDPYYTDENVSKEQGIIGQEIKMYDDDPSWRVYFNMLEAMFHNNPVKIDIAGTVESISHITPELLYKCHRQFYNPANMILVMVGDIDPAEAEKYIDKYVKPESNVGRQPRVMPPEPEKIVTDFTEQRLSVSSPLFFIGFKEKKSGMRGRELLEKEIETDILLEVLFGKSSDFYISLYNEGLIDGSFGKDSEIEPDYGFSAVSGESDDPQRVFELVKERVRAMADSGVDMSAAERAKKVMLGRYLRGFNDIEGIGNAFMRDFLGGINPLDYAEVLESVGEAELNERLREHFDADNCTLSVIRPVE